MAITFTNNIAQYTTSASTQRTSYFATYASKKQLQQAQALEGEALEFLLALKNTFTFAVHTNKQFAAVTLYYASTKSYKFIVCDLCNKAVAEVASIKQAKAEILELVNEQ